MAFNVNVDILRMTQAFTNSTSTSRAVISVTEQLSDAIMRASALQGVAVSAEAIRDATAEYVVQIFSQIAASMTQASIDQAGMAIRSVDYINLSQNTARFLAVQGPEFIRTINMTAISEILGSEFSRAVVEFVQTVDVSSIVNQIVLQINAAALNASETLNLTAPAQALSLEVRDALLQMEPVKDAIVQLVGGLSQGIWAQTTPYLLLTVGALLGIGFSILYLYRRTVHNIGRPNLAVKIKRKRFSLVASLIPTRVFSYFHKPSPQHLEPVFNPAIMRRIQVFSAGVRHLHSRGRAFQNLLLYGPGGTGKTMIAEKIAEESGLSYVMMSGGDLPQYIKRGEHVTELNRLLSSMEGSPTILFIDEFEGIAKRRDARGVSQGHIELLNRLLHVTGTASKTLCLIGATNRPEDIDPAMLTRMDHKIFIGPPEEEQRRLIILQNLEQNFTAQDIEQFFDEEQLTAIVEQTQGFTGRMLQKLVNEIALRKDLSDDGLLTKEIIDQTVRDYVEQEARMREIELASDRSTPASVDSDRVTRREHSLEERFIDDNS